MANIIAAAEITNADAIHPGYGFLSENAKFSEICRQNKIKFIGASPEMINAMGDKGGSIVNTASVAVEGNFGQANYAASKAGIVGLTKTLAIECAKGGIRVNCVAPGATDTKMFAGVPDDVKAQFAGEGAVPYPAERERKNVGNFYKVLGQRTVGSGGCVATEPRTEYSKQLATFEPLPASLVDYEPLRQKVLGYVGKGGVVGIKCKGGKGGIAVVYTERPNARGYDLITIYND